MLGIFGCDTEVSGIDLTREGPVGNGKVTCVSVYGGPNFDFGNGKNTLWIDTLDGETGVLEKFSEFFGSKKQTKVWHNYSFDRHSLFNHGINVEGLEGDTMHMARLWDTARTYSLEKSEEEEKNFNQGYSLESLSEDLLDRGKTSMKDLFGKPVLKKDGTPGKKLVLPSMDEIQRDTKSRDKWIEYSCYDAISTFHLYQALCYKLERMPWKHKNMKKTYSMLDFYQQIIRPFGEILTDIEREGFRVNHEEHLGNTRKQAELDREEAFNRFISWAQTCGAFKSVEDARRFNINSSAQKQMLFFGKNGYLQPNGQKKMYMERSLRFALEKGESSRINELSTKLKALQPKKGIFKVENIEQVPTFVQRKNGISKRVNKYREMEILGLGLTPEKYTQSGFPSTQGLVLSELSKNLEASAKGKGEKMNELSMAFGGVSERLEAKKAIDSLIKVNEIDKMLSTFIIPLKEMVDSRGRIHCSLNLNTETGRLSSRRPNLQNQPALEKDLYKIRDAFTAEEGKSLIVADYGQLELRVLAEITDCKSMKEAFVKGGDFHSRTAMGMYDYIKEEINQGKVFLDKSDAPADASDIVLVKDKFSSERRKAKVLNFSIAYGKTVKGLAADFGVSEKEAQETVDRWYADRPEVRDWQKKTIAEAHKTGYVKTIWGRYRLLKGINSRKPHIRYHMERAAINTPIQGSAADVVMAAMISVANDEWFKRNGWKMVLQVHDEIIMEGPEEGKEEATERLVAIMRDPFSKLYFKDPVNFDVELTVDAEFATTWYQAK
eukprot:snap_masked-scaffold_2-processed-gene-10.27-mRNA-1 protein AED:0.04 eAED:0.04 QI:0/0/0/1/1/1/2/0/777